LAGDHFVCGGLLAGDIEVAATLLGPLNAKFAQSDAEAIKDDWQTGYLEMNTIIEGVWVAGAIRIGRKIQRVDHTHGRFLGQPVAECFHHRVSLKDGSVNFPSRMNLNRCRRWRANENDRRVSEASGVQDCGEILGGNDTRHLRGLNPQESRIPDDVRPAVERAEGKCDGAMLAFVEGFFDETNKLRVSATKPVCRRVRTLKNVNARGQAGRGEDRFDTAKDERGARPNHQHRALIHSDPPNKAANTTTNYLAREST
jgi:hypothetical protein